MPVPLTLIQPCRRWLKSRLHLAVIALLPLLLAATSSAPEATPARVSRVATVTVQIIKLEPVSARVTSKDINSADRQFRQRDEMPLVEFF
jgi:uncharacterized membrane protein